jgi:hypothetical protein
MVDKDVIPFFHREDVSNGLSIANAIPNCAPFLL